MHVSTAESQSESFCMIKCKHTMQKKYGVKGYIVDLVSLQLQPEHKQLQDKLAKERPQLFLMCSPQSTLKADQQIIKPGNLLKIIDPVFLSQIDEKKHPEVAPQSKSGNRRGNKRAAQQQVLELDYVYEMYVPVFAT